MAEQTIQQSIVCPHCKSDLVTNIVPELAEDDPFGGIIFRSLDSGKRVKEKGLGTCAHCEKEFVFRLQLKANVQISTPGWEKGE